MKGGKQIRKLWEIFKTHEPPCLLSSDNAYHDDDNGFFLDNDSQQYDIIIKDIFNQQEDFDENFLYYLQFINKHTLKFTLTCGNNTFLEFLKSAGIKAKEVDGSEIFQFLENSKELFSSIVLFNLHKYLKYEDSLDFIKLVYKKIEFGGSLIIELPDSLLCNECSFSPESLERICKEFRFSDIRTYKTPLNESGTYQYLIIARKCYN